MLANKWLMQMLLFLPRMWSIAEGLRLIFYIIYRRFSVDFFSESITRFKYTPVEKSRSVIHILLINCFSQLRKKCVCNQKRSESFNAIPIKLQSQRIMKMRRNNSNCSSKIQSINSLVIPILQILIIIEHFKVISIQIEFIA